MASRVSAILDEALGHELHPQHSLLMSPWRGRWRWFIDKLGGATISLLLLGVLGVTRTFSPYLQSSVATPVWLLVWLALTITAVVVLQRLRPAPPPVFLSSGAIANSKEAEAYILLEIQPGNSEHVARTLSQSNVVSYAAAVWGPWDVILRVEAGRAEAFARFLEYLQELDGVRRTETYFIRHDQPRAGADLRNAGKWAFLLLKLEVQRTSDVLAGLAKRFKFPTQGVRLQHVAGVFGPYDIALTVRYGQDAELKRFEIQIGVGAESMTIPAIEELVFIDGERAG